MWRVAGLHNELMDLTKENSRKNVESTNWLFLAAYDKIQG